MNADDLAFMTVRDLAPLIRERKVSPVELVDAQLARIEALDDVLRAYIFVNGDQARAAAKAAEAEIASGGYRGELHGVTVAHKDIIDVSGLPTTAASNIMSGYVAREDSTVSARLRSAGAICLGKLNLIEFASGSMGVYGFARNPHNLGASPGGSSSGSGVAAAAGLATIVTGTDTGGSVRNPASFCGLVGLRPTYGRVSRYGCVPLSWSQDSIGPMARSITDVAIMLSEMSGADRHDPTASLKSVPDFTLELETGMQGLRIGIPQAFFFEDLNSEVENALKQAIAVLEELGAEIKPVELPASEYASSASWVIAYSESFVHHHQWFQQRSREYTPAFYHKITAAGLTSAEERIISQRIRQVVTREFAKVMQSVDVIITPTSRTLASGPQASPDSSRALPWSSEMCSVTRPVSLAGYPALSIPIGFASDNTPIGMQLIGRPWEESTLFRAGYAYGRSTSWGVQRPPAFPDEIPPRFGATPPPAEPPATGRVSPAWVMDMARLLEFDFVTEDDGEKIASILSPVKEQLWAAQRHLAVDLEPPTRAAGVF
jgi:aspartyl-tRNA(Asn)/glutamyl-tRNA(Gln) amidotransferase subunit A